MEAGTVSQKVTISYRGAKYEIGRGKRFYGIWVVDAPASDPIDRWPLTSEGWTQAWTRYVAIETPGTIAKVEKPRAGFKLALPKRPGAADGPNPGASDGPDPGRPSRALASAGLLGLGLLLGLIGLFPGYFGSQSLASQAYQLVPHLLYLLAWAVSCALIALGAGRRSQTPRIGALLGAGLSAVTFGLFWADLGQVISGGSSLGTGLVLSLLGWLACTAGSLLALTVRPHTATPETPPVMSPAPPSQAGQPFAGPYLPGAPFAASPRASRGRATGSGPARPRLADAGPLALVVLAAIGAVAAFLPSWDSYIVASSAQGTSESFTAGNAFSNPGVMIAGSVAVMIAAIGVAALAALWRPVRHGAMLLTGATVALIAQAISALIQVTGPAPFALFGLTQAQATANGVTISSGLTPIFWVYCVFVISLVVSIAWMLTAPHYPVMPAAPVSPEPGPTDPQQDVDGETADSDDDAEDDAESSYA
jgi:hypothetical protein